MKSKRKDASDDSQQPLRVGGYIRVSSQRQASEGDSLEAQTNEICEEVKTRRRREGWKVTEPELYVDAGKSAKDQNRPQLQRLKQDIAAGLIQVVICFKLDRITRSLPDFIDLWELFDRHGVTVISLREQFDSSTPTGKAMLRLIMVFAELEREMTAERTFATMKDRVERGLWNGGHVLGYVTDPKEKGKLLVDPDWAPIIKQNFFDAFEQLGSSTAVLRRLNELGIKKPIRQSRAGKQRGGQAFTKQQVLGILRNPIYIGRIQWGESHCENSHEPLIDPAQFARVQNRAGEASRHRRNHRYARGRTYLLRGLVRCACGAHMTPAGAQGRNSTYHYYVCTRQLQEGKTCRCQAPRVPAEALEAAVLNRVKELGNFAESRDRIVEAATRCLDQEGQRIKAEEEIVGRQLAKTKGDINRLIEVLKSLGTSALSSVESELVRLQAEEQKLQAELRRLAKSQSPIDRLHKEARQFLATWRNVGQILDEATPEELQIVLQHYIEVLELRATAEDGATGTYGLRLFPEVRPTGESQASTAHPDGLPATTGQESAEKKKTGSSP